MRFVIHAYYSIWAWTYLVTLIFIFSQLTSSSFAFEDLFLNEYPAGDDDSSSSSNLFLGVDDFGGGGGGSSYLTEPQPVFDADNNVLTNPLSSMNLLADASDDAPPDSCIEFSPPSSFKNIKARAATSCNNPDINGVDAGAGAGTRGIESNKIITAEQIKRYWCTDFTSASVSVQEGGFGSIPVCYGPEGQGLSGSSEGGPILPNWSTGFDQSADFFRTLYNCVLSELLFIL